MLTRGVRGAVAVPEPVDDGGAVWRGPARLPSRRRRPRRRDPGAARELSERLTVLSRPSPRDPRRRRSTQAPVSALRASPTTGSSSTPRWRRGHRHHRVSRDQPVRPLGRRRGAAGAATASSTSPTPTTSRCWPSSSNCGTNRPRCSATRPGPRTSPRPRWWHRPAIRDFVDRVAADARRAGKRDMAVLLERARRRTSVEAIEMASWHYYAERVRREQFDLDAQQVRPYFDFGSVKQGVLDITEALRRALRAGERRARWHADVATYDVFEGEEPDRPHLPRHAPARRQVQARRAVRLWATGGRRAAARRRAGLQLPPAPAS